MFSDRYAHLWCLECDVFDSDFFFADRVVLVRRENRVPLELEASRFGSTHSAETF